MGAARLKNNDLEFREPPIFYGTGMNRLQRRRSTTYVERGTELEKLGIE